MNATILELAKAQGITANALKKWKKREYVPFKHRFALLDLAEQKGVKLDRRDLDWRKRPATKKRARAA